MARQTDTTSGRPRRRPGLSSASKGDEPTARAIAYLRVSTSLQEERGLSLPEQREKVEAYALAHGLELLRVVQETASAGVRDGELFSWEHRPVLSDLLEHAKSGAYDVLLVAKFDRLSRDAATLTIIERMTRQHGVSVISADEDNGDSATGRLMRHTLAGFAEYERELIRERLRFGKAQAKRRGRHVHGRAPYGYRSERGVLEPDQERAEIVKRVFTDAIAGYSAGQIAKRLNYDDTPSPQGGAQGWGADGVRLILRNPAYTGEKYGKRKAHTPIVSKRVWNQAQEALKARSRAILGS